MALGFEMLQQPAQDKIFGIVNQYKEDARANKVNLAIGAYTDATGRTVCFEAVKKAFQKLSEDPESGYLPPVGDKVFTDLSQKLVFNADDVNNRIASVQSPSGTGALTLAGELAKMILPVNKPTKVYVSDPTWPIHVTLFNVQLGYEVGTYRYWSQETKGVNFEGMKEDINNAPERSIIITHACAHNPTGQDLTEAQWETIFDICIARKHLLIIDCAYQGFASGDFLRDGWAVKRALERYTIEGQDIPYQFIVCQSYAKNMSLYGHRTGCVHVVCSDAENANRARGHVGNIGRRIWSNPPRQGSDACKLILTDPNLKELWLRELRAVSDSIKKIREELRSALEKRTNQSWKHLTDQIGMFAYTGLSVSQCQSLRQDHGIYLLDTGRISLAGIQPTDIPIICDAIAIVVNNSN